MFRCENKKCNKVCEPRQPQHTVVVQTRDKQYQRKIYKHGKVVHVEDTYGTEIVKELKVCPECYQQMTGEEPMRIQASTNIHQLREAMHEQAKPKPWNKHLRKHDRKREPKVQRINHAKTRKDSK